MYTNAKSSTVRKAVAKISNKYAGNVVFDRKPESVRKTFNYIRFTVRTKNKLAPPSRLSANGRPIYKVSWQVFGQLMEEIFKIEPQAEIKTATGTYKKGFQWADVDIRTDDQRSAGVAPIYYSQTSITKPITL
jgi:hypothetical protein